MSINAASITVGATFAPTGGSATTLKTKTLSESKHVVFLDDGASIAAQTVLEFSQKQPKVSSSAPNGYTQQRNTVLIKFPFALDNGSSTVNTAKVEVACDVELTAAEKLSMREYLLHLLSDSDFLEFWDDQSLA